MTKKTFTTSISNKTGSVSCWIELPFDPKEVFGSMRAPVKVTVRGYTYRTTTTGNVRAWAIESPRRVYLPALQPAYTLKNFSRPRKYLFFSPAAGKNTEVWSLVIALKRDFH